MLKYSQHLAIWDFIKGVSAAGFAMLAVFLVAYVYALIFTPWWEI